MFLKVGETDMTIQEAMRQRNMSIYRLAKTSEVPYATLNDICNGKARLEKCSAETIYKIAHALDISMEDLLAPCFLKRSSFENFKSTVCHRVKEMGDIQWYPESLYLLAMLDYISRENNVPLCDDYDDLRRCRLEHPVYPTSIRAIAAATKSDSAMKDAASAAIPEFRRFNIIENEVRNVI